MLCKRLSVFLILFSLYFLSSGQTPKIDSLLSLLKTSKEDTNKVNTLFELINELDDSKSMILYSQEALRISEKLNFKMGIGRSCRSLGNIYIDIGDYPRALDYFSRSLKIFEEINSRKNIFNAFNGFGIIYFRKGDYAKALEYYFKALRIIEELGDKEGMATIYGNIGGIYVNQEDYTGALEQLFKALKINEELGDKRGLAFVYNNIGIVYLYQENYAEALKNYFKSLDIKKVMNDTLTSHFANTIMNIGLVYKGQGDYGKALEYYFKSLKIREKIEDKDGTVTVYNNIGELYTKQKKYAQASEYLFKGLMLAKEIGNKEDIQTSYKDLSELDSAQGNWKNAYAYHKLYVVYTDSMKEEEATKNIIRTQMNYEFDKKQREERLIQQQKDELTKEATRRQSIVRNFLIAGCFLMLLVAGLVYRSFSQTRKANKIIAAQKNEVELQKSIVDIKNKDITDSINYAKRIQEAVFPEKEIKYKLFPDAFVYFRPRDIVSGDFYWFAEKNGKRFIAAVDCTGHGVPGAFMSIIGNHLLNEIVLTKGILQPAEILNQLHKGVRDVLKQEEQKSHDGMDVALCSFEDNGRVEYAGAHRPLYLVSEGGLTEIKEDKFHIGGADLHEDKKFTNHVLELKRGDVIYISSDGYADQFGGEKGKKMMSKNLKNLLLVNSNLSMPRQESLLNETFGTWKGNREQVDDVLVIGVRV